MPAGVISIKSARRLSPAEAVLQHAWRQTRPRFPRVVRTPFKRSKTGDGTHSLRRTKAAQIYRKTGNLQALKLQQDDLKAQRLELQETRPVLAKQTFEATFFRMLELVREVEPAWAIRTGGGDSPSRIRSMRARPAMERSRAKTWLSERSRSGGVVSGSERSSQFGLYLG